MLLVRLVLHDIYSTSFDVGGRTAFITEGCKVCQLSPSAGDRNLNMTSFTEGYEMLKSKYSCAGAELREQVAELQRQYTEMGDQLEDEQNRIIQVRRFLFTLACCGRFAAYPIQSDHA